MPRFSFRHLAWSVPRALPREGPAASCLRAAPRAAVLGRVRARAGGVVEDGAVLPRAPRRPGLPAPRGAEAARLKLASDLLGIRGRPAVLLLALVLLALLPPRPRHGSTCAAQAADRGQSAWPHRRRAAGAFQLAPSSRAPPSLSSFEFLFPTFLLLLLRCCFSAALRPPESRAAPLLSSRRTASTLREARARAARKAARSQAAARRTA